MLVPDEIHWVSIMFVVSYSKMVVRLTMAICRLEMSVGQLDRFKWVTSGNTFHLYHVVFCPHPAKADTVSQPAKSCQYGIAK